MKNDIPDHVLENVYLRVEMGLWDGGESSGYGIKRISAGKALAYRVLLEGRAGHEFVTGQSSGDALHCDVQKGSDGNWVAELSGETEGWTARERIVLSPDQPYVKREQTYTFKQALRTAIRPGFVLPSDPDLRYTFALKAHEVDPACLSPLRAAVDWAVPFPFHVWHVPGLVALYGLDKRSSFGTLDFMPAGRSGSILSVYYPDSAGTQPGAPVLPQEIDWPAGAIITLTEIIAVQPLADDEEPLLEAERLAAGLLLHPPVPRPPVAGVADRMADFYRRCELWEPNALGVGQGWFSNMWIRTQTGPARKRGEMSGYFDLGWGEGIAVESMLGMIRHWKRTGATDLLAYVNTMSRNLDRFKRAPGDAQPYFDRSDGTRFGDFLMDVVPGSRIWTHSLGHSGSQLLQMYAAAPDYPQPDIRAAWLSAAGSMARFLGAHQRPDGDLQDIFDEHNAEVNRKPHRITARAVVCGLWVRWGHIQGDPEWIQRAERLVAAVAPEINRYEYYNQMLDGIYAPDVEYVDGEAAYYVLEGLVPLYAATRRADLLALCRKAAAFGIAWTYFYNVPRAHQGVARGGQCCRMDDFPLLYPIGSAKALPLFLDLYALTGDSLFKVLAGEAAAFISSWQMEAPDKPWDGGMIHALGQYCGKHWGPDLAGQVDTGMATGNSFAALEAWLAQRTEI